MFGEIALLERGKSARVLSAMTKTDCILVELNSESFELLAKEKIKR
jgi:CRP-like cAMP-binding protein